MTYEELLGSLRAIELRLSTSEISSFIRRQDDATQQRISDLILQVSIRVSQLETAQLNDIADRLDQLGAQLQAGISSLQTAIIQINSAIAIVNTLSTVVSLTGRVLGLAV